MLALRIIVYSFFLFLTNRRIIYVERKVCVPTYSYIHRIRRNQMICAKPLMYKSVWALWVAALQARSHTFVVALVGQLCASAPNLLPTSCRFYVASHLIIPNTLYYETYLNYFAVAKQLILKIDVSWPTFICNIIFKDRKIHLYSKYLFVMYI